MSRGRDRFPYRATGATCMVCGIHAGNSLNMPVYRYRLQRSSYREGGTQKSENVGAIGLCDACITKHAQPLRDYSGRNTAQKHRHLRLEGGEDEWHLHAGYQPRHRHPELGPDRGFEVAPTPIGRARSA